MAKKSQSPADAVKANWTVRQNFFAQKGIPKTAFSEIMKRDISNVQQGGSPLTKEQVGLEVQAAINSPNTIKDPKPHADWNPLHVLSHVPTDIGHIIEGFPVGVAKSIYHLPSEVTNTAKSFYDPATQAKLGFEFGGSPLTKLAKGLRNAERVPLLSLLTPGLHTASDLTTKAGRQDISLHPVSTLLDILPAAAKVGEVALAGRVAEEGSALEALQRGSKESGVRGNPLKAAFRAAGEVHAKVGPVEIRGRTLDPVTGKLLPSTSYMVKKIAERMNVSRDVREMARGLQDEKLAAEDVAVAARKSFQDVTSKAATKWVDEQLGMVRKNFVTEHVMPLTKTLPELTAQLEHDFRSQARSTADLERMVESEIESAWHKPAGNVYQGVEWEKDRLVPRHTHDALNKLNRPDSPLKWLKRPTNLFKSAVMWGPRHLTHVTAGGMMMGATYEPGFLTHLGTAFKLATHKMTNEEAGISDTLMRNVSRGGGTIFDHEESLKPVNDVIKDPTKLTADQAWHHLAGRKLAHYFKQANGSMKKIEEASQTIYRTAMALEGKAKGLSDQATLDLVHKVFVDTGNMTPIERTVFKQIFPFYPFTRQLMKYVFSLPVDHPIRADILAQFANQEFADWNSGLPQHFQMMFFLGQPDANGNVTGVDLRNLNPFRSLSNMFTLTGFFQSVNPAIAAAMEIGGTNTLSGAADPFAGSYYDTYSGTIKASRSDQVPKLIETFFPESSILDRMFNFSDNMRALKRNSPEAYRSALFNALNLPFAFGPINPSFEKGKAEKNRLLIAQQAVSAAMKSGDTSGLSKFNLVPFQGQLVPPSYIRQLLALIEQTQALQGTQSLSPKASVSSSQLKLLARQA